jgi:RNA-binding protein YlmH
MAAAVDGQKVQVNWQIAKGVSQSVSEGDIVSLRGRGRIVIKAVTGVSRKGRTGILVEKYR